MILIIDCGSKKTPAISTLVAEHYPNQKIVSKEEFSQSDIDDCTGIILSGAPLLLTQMDLEPVKKRFSFLKEVNVPVLGICFGHQLIGLVFGAEAFLGKAVRQLINVEILHPSPIFNGLPESAEFCQDHTEGISLPEGFLHLAKSAEYLVEAIKHPEKSIWGVQFHPEVSGGNGRLLFKNFIDVVRENEISVH
jgi:GMP synthase (glutamine-hydrolysing)